METKAKRQYNQIASELIKKGKEDELAKRLELLKLFLEYADFNKLRSESEKHLLEEKKVKFVLHLEEGKPEYEMKIITE